MTDKQTIKYIIPIGKDCKIGKFLKANELKKTSYPFDWLFTETDQSVIPVILENNFVDFLNPEFHVKIGNKMSSHTLYKENHCMFRHHNILDDDSLNYYKRCVNRFMKIHKIVDPKLYIIDVDELENIMKIIEYLEKNAVNFYVFVITKQKKYEKELTKSNIKVGYINLILNFYEFDLIEDTNLIMNERTKGYDRFDRINK